MEQRTQGVLNDLMSQRERMGDTYKFLAQMGVVVTYNLRSRKPISIPDGSVIAWGSEIGSTKRLRDLPSALQPLTGYAYACVHDDEIFHSWSMDLAADKILDSVEDDTRIILDYYVMRDAVLVKQTDLGLARHCGNEPNAYKRVSEAFSLHLNPAGSNHETLQVLEAIKPVAAQLMRVELDKIAQTEGRGRPGFDTAKAISWCFDPAS
jgi:hypothetical protein